ncbi:MAG: aminoglycoside phosphotransferase family protein [Candidatus Thorarchaeota archaeon]
MTYKSEIKLTSNQIKKIFKDVIPNESIISVNEIKESFTNPVFDVGMSSDEHFILKINNPTWPLKQSREVTTIQLAQSKTSIPLPKIIANDTTKKHIKYDFLILEKRPGIQLRNCLDNKILTSRDFLSIIEKLGEYLGELHSITFDFYGDITVGKNSSSIIENNSPFWGRRFVTWKEAFANLCNDSLQWVDNKSFPQYRKTMLILIDYFLKSISEPEKGVLVHSDLQPTNILIHNTAISALLDFEWSYSGSASFDFALTKAGLFFSTFPSLEKHIITKFFPDLQLSEIDDIFTKGYQRKTVHLISPEVPDLITFIWLLYMIGSWSWIVKTSRIDEIQQFERDIANTFSYLNERYL